VSFPSSEAAAARELGHIRLEVDRWSRADKGAWPIVGGYPRDHDHHLNSARHMVTVGRVTWNVCPPGCERPVRWAVA
jgi:hypothetical protein